MFNTLDPTLKKSTCIIIGLGDTHEDIKYLFEWIEKHNSDRVTIYALHPINGLEYDKGPSTEELAWWIAQVRIKFPKLQIIAGIAMDRFEEVDTLLRAGANAITKFPITKHFGSEQAHEIERRINSVDGRQFVGTLTQLKDQDWGKVIDELDIPQEYKEEMKEKIKPYLKRMGNPPAIHISTNHSCN